MKKDVNRFGRVGRLAFRELVMNGEFEVKDEECNAVVADDE